MPKENCLGDNAKFLQFNAGDRFQLLQFRFNTYAAGKTGGKLSESEGSVMENGLP